MRVVLILGLIGVWLVYVLGAPTIDEIMKLPDAKLAELGIAPVGETAKGREERYAQEQRAKVIQRIRSLQVSIQGAKVTLSQYRSQEQDIKKHIDDTMARKVDVRRHIDSIAEGRRTVEQRLAKVKGDLPEVDEVLERVMAENRKAEIEAVEKNKEYQELLEQYTTLADQLKEHPGLEMWLNKRIQKLPPLVQATILKTSRDLVGPMISGIQDVATLNDQLSEEMSRSFDGILPAIRGSPFYRGILFYLILLFPLFLVSNVVHQIRKHLGRLTVAHHIFLSNLYFSVLFLVCFLMSASTRQVIFHVFRHRNEAGFEAFVLIHFILLLRHVALHLLLLSASRETQELAESFTVTVCALHFFVNVFKPTMVDRDPTSAIWNFAFYCIVFGLISINRASLIQSWSFASWSTVEPASSTKGD
uniref:Uncharacterized protein n=1 Tax=Compsopogon caeruleus TaxID=31354 RepID=A0A7S1TBH1_9RHOD|mmetsp:Transcript_14988/g.30461  ORF Transcript_14988/g.30461 Transcript_14988/m.30461 type:complete len:418 (+) Transcript_14988:70-1323(+)